MATYIIDRQHQLNSDLVQLFHLDAQAPIDHDLGHDAAKHPTSSRPGSNRAGTRHLHHHHHRHQTAPNAATTQGTAETIDDKHSELLSGLRASIDAIDLRSASLPSMAKVATELDKVAALFKAHPTARPPPLSGTTSSNGNNYRSSSNNSKNGSSTRPRLYRSPSSTQSLSSSLTTSSYFAEEAPTLPQVEAGATDGSNKKQEQQTPGANDVERVVARLETLFLAKCTVAVYLNLMHSILNATLPLADEMDYWQGLLESWTWRSVYIVQTSPRRFYDLTKSVAIRTREHVESLVESGTHHGHMQHLVQLLHYFPAFLNKHIISRPVRFPDAIHYEIGYKRKQLQRIREYQAECLGMLAEQGLSLDVDQILMAALEGSRDLEQEREEEARVNEHVQTQMSRTIQLMQQVLAKGVSDVDGTEAGSADQKAVGNKNGKGLHRSLTLIGRMHGVGILPTNDVYEHLSQLIHTSIPAYMSTTDRQARQYHRPGWITRFWVPTLVSYFALNFGIQYVSNHRADLDQFLQEAYETARNFLQDWVWEPSKRIMAIIQHKDDQGSLQMLGNDSLNSDIASLKRMVLDFSSQHSQLTDEQLRAITDAVQNGDISVVMKAYEKELKTPLKGAVMGNLIQTLLIQVQKSKVDLEVAMAALDKLLKANELNFAFLAVGPSLLLLWFITSQAHSAWRRAAGHNLGVVSIQMRDSLRQVERLLNLAATGATEGHARKAGPLPSLKVPLTTGSASGQSTSAVGKTKSRLQQQQQPSESDMSDDLDTPGGSKDPESVRALEKRVNNSRMKKGKVPYKTQGLILCEVHLLRTFARQLPKRDGLQENVMQDLRELEESSLTVHQRLRTAARMYRTYGFLGLYH